jgi:hypothetical protein
MHILRPVQTCSDEPAVELVFSACHVSRSCASRSPANPREENYAVSSDFETASYV